MRLPAIILAIAPAVWACGLASRDANSTDDSFIMGPDTPSDPETKGYFINHLALNTNNLTRSLDFYTKIFGMRHMFTMKITEHFSVTYMGYSQGGRNGTGYQTTEELIRFKQDSAGMLELLYFNTSTPGQKPIPGTLMSTNTLNHIGMIVPDIDKTQKRLEDYGVTIHKKVDAEWPNDGPLGTPYSVGDAAGLSDEAWEEQKKAMAILNKKNIFASDPDGNVLEILPFIEPAGLF